MLHLRLLGVLKKLSIDFPLANCEIDKSLANGRWKMEN